MVRWLKSPDCSCRRPEFRSRHPHGGSQLSATLIQLSLRGLLHSLALMFTHVVMRETGLSGAVSHALLTTTPTFFHSLFWLLWVLYTRGTHAYKQVKSYTIFFKEKKRRQTEHSLLPVCTHNVTMHLAFQLLGSVQTWIKTSASFLLLQVSLVGYFVIATRRVINTHFSPH